MITSIDDLVGIIVPGDRIGRIQKIVREKKKGEPTTDDQNDHKNTSLSSESQVVGAKRMGRRTGKGCVWMDDKNLSFDQFSVARVNPIFMWGGDK